MAINHGNKLSGSTSLSFTTNGKAYTDVATILTTDYSSNLTINTPAPSIWENSTVTYKRSVSQDSPISATITGFNNGEYTVEYTWKDNNPDTPYYTGNLTVKPEHIAGMIDSIAVFGGSKTINATGITYHVPSNLTINRYSPVTLSGKIPNDSTYNKGGTISDNEFYSYEAPIRNGDQFILQKIYGPAQKAGKITDLSGVLTLTSNSSWLTFDNGTTKEEYTFDNKSNSFPTITVNATTNTPHAKYGTAKGELDYSPKISSISETATTHKITLSGLEKVTDADDSIANTDNRTAQISYSFLNYYITGNKMDDTVMIYKTGNFNITQEGGNVTVPNPKITYTLTYKSANYTVDGDNFIPVKTTDNTFTVNFGSVEGKEGEVSGNISGDFPDSFEVYGGTTNVNINGLNLTKPVDYPSRNIKFTAGGKIDYVNEVNNSTVGITANTYTTSKEITISQGGLIHNIPEAEIQWYIDSAKTNAIPTGKLSTPSLSISSNPISLGNSSKTISLTATSNEARSLYGGIAGELAVSLNNTIVPASGGTVTITGDPKHMAFIDGEIPATNSAYFRVRGYSTSNTKGIDKITKVEENSFGHDFSNAKPGSGNLVYNKLIYIKGQDRIINGKVFTNATFSSTIGTVIPNSLTFSSSSSSKQTSWKIPAATQPNTSLSYEMSSDNTRVTVSMSGSNLSSSTYKLSYSCNGKSGNYSVTRSGRNQLIDTILNVGGDTTYLNTNGKSFPMKYQSTINTTYTFNGWSFKNIVRNTLTTAISWNPNTLDFGSSATELSKSSVLSVTTAPENYTPKTITFTLSGIKQYPDESGVTTYSKNWNVNVPVTTIVAAAPIISVTPEGYGNYFTYTWDNATSKFTGTFKAVKINKSSLTINNPTYNTNGWDKYFTVNYVGESGGDSERNITVTAKSGDKTAILTCHRGIVTVSTSPSKTITFNITNNDPDFITLACPTTTIKPNNNVTIYPTSTEKDLSSIPLDKFDNYISAIVNIGSSKPLPPILTNITTTDANGNPQLGAFDTGTYHFYSGLNLLDDTITLTKTATGTTVCVQDTTKSSNYSKKFNRTINIFDIINISNPNYTWSITHNSGAGFLSIDNNGTLTLNPSNYNVTNENGVDETVTCTVTFGSPAKDYFGRSTISRTKTLHIDGKHYVNIPL